MMGSHLFHCGKPGTGQAAKVSVQGPKEKQKGPLKLSYFQWMAADIHAFLFSSSNTHMYLYEL